MIVDQVREQLKQRLRSAMKAREAVEVETLRMLLGAIDNAEAVAAPAAIDFALMLGEAEVARRELSHPEIMSIFQGERAECVEALDQYTQLGLADEAARFSEMQRCIDVSIASVEALDTPNPSNQDNQNNLM